MAASSQDGRDPCPRLSDDRRLGGGGAEELGELVRQPLEALGVRQLDADRPQGRRRAAVLTRESKRGEECGRSVRRELHEAQT
jgi:hypothetical protein